MGSWRDSTKKKEVLSFDADTANAFLEEMRKTTEALNEASLRSEKATKAALEAARRLEKATSEAKQVVQARRSGW